MLRLITVGMAAGLVFAQPMPGPAAAAPAPPAAALLKGASSEEAPRLVPGRLEFTQKPDGQKNLLGAYVSLNALLEQLSKCADGSLSAEDELKWKRVHLAGKGFVGADLRRATAFLADGEWRRKDAGLVLVRDRDRLEVARKLRSAYPEFPANSSYRDDKEQLALASTLMEAVRSPDGAARLRLANPALARALETKPFLRSMLSALGGLAPYELFMLTGSGLRRSAAEVSPFERQTLVQAAAAHSGEVGELQWVGGYLDGERLAMIAEFEPGARKQLILGQNVALDQPAADRSKDMGRQAKTGPGEVPPLPEMMVTPRDIVVSDKSPRGRFDWPAVLDDLARATGLRYMSDTYHRPFRRGESLHERMIPLRRWTREKDEAVPLREFLPDLANRAGFSLHRVGDVILFKHLQWYWEPKYRFEDKAVERSISTEPKQRATLDFVTSFLNLGAPALEGLSQPFPEFGWAAQNPAGALFYASLSRGQRDQIRRSLPYTTLSQSQASLFWAWQEVPPHLVPVQLREPLQVTGGGTSLNVVLGEPRGREQ